MTNMTRNISQTVQEREIVKTAPDIVVYIDGLPYLINPYIYAGNQNYTLVNFNDQVSAFSATYDVDNLKPSADVVVSVPNHLKYLYQAPGGNNIIESMSELQVFAKNYFPSPNGNSVYSRVFKGIISHVSHTDTGKSLEIQIQAQGILRFFEIMQIELNPSLLSNAERTAQALINNQGNLDPYQQLADTFLRGITFEGFQLNSLLQQRVAASDFAQAVKAGFINKWQQTLVGIRKDVHIFGYSFGSVLPADINGISNPDISKGKMGPDYFAISDNTYGKNLESDPSHDLYTSQIKGYLPDFRIGTIQLLNGQIVTRMERIRTIVQSIGMEAFQDINGEIIVKPPLYNLDVTNITPLPTVSSISTSSSPTANAAQAANVNQKFTEQHNPFIVQLVEILSENETEDEQAIRCTRMSVQGDWSTQFHAGEGTQNLRAVASHIDIPKLTKFGLREEPARSLNWIRDSDKFAMYTYAVSEMNRANRGYRTYQITIPIRPELHLGFPMYFPHKDMYGYIRSVGISYQMGGEATMNILLDTLRKRPLFPAEHTLPNTMDGTTTQPKKVIIYTTQPNLVMRWTEPPNAATAGNNTALTSQQATTDANAKALQAYNPLAPSTNMFSMTAAGTGDVCSDNPAVNFKNVPATQLQSTAAPVYQEQIQVTNYRRSQLGTEWGTKADTTTKSFRVQADSETPELSTVSGVPTGQPFFSRSRWLTPQPAPGSAATNSQGNPTPPVTSSGGQVNTPQQFGIDAIYFQRILFEQPFTDEKGYEVVTPFPWGRWKSLLEAYSETRQGQLVDYVNPQDLQMLTQTNAFLFTGLGTPQGSLEPGGALQDALSVLKSQIESKDSFELSSTVNEPSSESTILNTQQPEDRPTSDNFNTAGTNADLQKKVNLFIQGGPSRSLVTQSILEVADEAGNFIGQN